MSHKIRLSDFVSAVIQSVQKFMGYGDELLTTTPHNTRQQTHDAHLGMCFSRGVFARRHEESFRQRLHVHGITATAC